MNFDDCENIFEKIRASNDESLLRQSFIQLLDVYQITNYSLGAGSIFWRGRKCLSKGGYSHPKELFCPPAHVCQMGRLNDAGDPALYLSTRDSTVLTEIGVESGGFVHFGGYRIRREENMRLAFIGDYYSVYKTGRSRVAGSVIGTAISNIINGMGTEEARRHLYIDAFLSDILSDASAATSGYVKTRVLWRLVRERLGIDGIFYPSVKDHIGLNLAVTAEAAKRKMKLVSSHVYSVDAVRKYGMFDGVTVATAIGVSAAGEFIFQSPEAGFRFVFSDDPAEVQEIAELANRKDVQPEIMNLEAKSSG